MSRHKVPIKKAFNIRHEESDKLGFEVVTVLS